MPLFTTSKHLCKFDVDGHICNIMMDMNDMYHKFNENNNLFSIINRICFIKITNHTEKYIAHTYPVCNLSLIINLCHKIS